MKQRAKKNASSAKIEHFKTGGGVMSSSSSTSDIDEKIMSILGNRATPLHNIFDCDAEFNGETGR